MNRKKIVIFTLDCLYSHAAVSLLIKKYHEDIVLICFSDRYGPKYGSFTHQLIKYFRECGIRFVMYMSYFFLLYELASLINYWIFGNRASLARLDKLCEAHKIPRLKTKDINSKEVEKRIRNSAPDIGISAYFDQIIKSNILNIPLNGIINIHPGILPDYRGPFPTIYAALAQTSDCGSTIHRMNEELDKGDIISIQRVLFYKNRSIMFYEWEVMRLGGEKMLELLADINNGINLAALPQKGGSYMGYPRKKEIKRLYSLGYKLYSLKDFFTILKS